MISGVDDTGLVDFDGNEFTDDELAALAVSVDPDEVEIDDDAVPFGVRVEDGALLPAWYMPAPMAGVGPNRRRRAIVVATVVIAMLAVNAVGLCVTYGVPEVGDRISSLR